MKVHSHKGHTALHAAAQRAHVAAIEVLVLGGAVLDDAANSSRYTPLKKAVANHHLLTLRWPNTLTTPS